MSGTTTPPPEARALEPALLRFAAAAGLAFVEIAVAPIRRGLGVVMVEPAAASSSPSPPARDRILDALSALLAPERPHPPRPGCRMILVCGGLADGVTELVCARLQHCGYPYRLLDLARYPDGYRVAWRWTDDGPAGGYIAGADWRLDLDAITASTSASSAPRAVRASRLGPRRRGGAAGRDRRRP